MSSLTDANPPYPKPCSVDPDRISPVSFTSGHLAGLTVRVELEEIQKADLGRKYARKDRRPLDPPPVAVCRFISIVDPLSANPSEQELQLDYATVGAVCHVDLFQVPDDYEKYIDIGRSEASNPAPDPHIPSAPMFSSSYILSSSSTMMPGSTPPTPSAGEAAESPPILPQLVPLSPFTTTSMSSQDRWTASSSIPSPMPSASAQNAMIPGVHSLPQFSMRGLTNAKQAPPSDSRDIVAWFGAFPIRESTKCTDMLAGGMFTQAEIVEYNGKREAMFVFHDLAVQKEGTFVLRYRTINLTSQTASNPPHYVLAECFGGPFKVYSTKDFPGLGPSTALTKLLALYNIRVNMRQTERKRRRKSEIEADRATENLRMPAPQPPRHPTAAENATAGPSSSREIHSPTTSVTSSMASGSSPRHPSRSAAARWHKPPGPRGDHMSRYESSDDG